MSIEEVVWWKSEMKEKEKKGEEASHDEEIRPLRPRAELSRRHSTLRPPAKIDEWEKGGLCRQLLIDGGGTTAW